MEPALIFVLAQHVLEAISVLALLSPLLIGQLLLFFLLLLLQIPGASQQFHLSIFCTPLVPHHGLCIFCQNTHARVRIDIWPSDAMP